VKQGLKYSLYSLIVFIGTIIAFFLLNSYRETGISYGDFILLSGLFCLTSITSLMIFFIGQEKDPKTSGFFSLVALTAKFLMEMMIALIWFLIIKKILIASVILFFVLYLTFTLFSIFMILKTLRNKSL
jgi:hypothetical protein